MRNKILHCPSFNHILSFISASLKKKKNKILTNSKYYETFNSWNTLRCLETSMVGNRNSRSSLNKKSRGYNTVSRMSEPNSSSIERAIVLDMDHHYVTFIDFLWVHTFVGPSAYFFWMKEVFVLFIRVKMLKFGWIKMKPFNVKMLVATLCLEQSNVIQYLGTNEENIAGFFFPDFAYIEDVGCQYRVADLFAVDIDLNKKEFVRARLDNKSLTASETLILLYFNAMGSNHVKLHALANWGVNHSDQIKNENYFLYRNSIITIVYNYFGYTCFKGYFSTWKSMGLLSKKWLPDTLIDCFNHGLRENIWQHSNIVKLSKYSRFVNFIVRTRGIFLSEFTKHKKSFPGIDGEAMFVGTVLHSLDHSFMDWNLEDPLWLDVDHPHFGMMAEICRIVKVGFTSDLPYILFSKRFKDCGQPFYESVYKKAAKIDKELADLMDTCIVK